MPPTIVNSELFIRNLEAELERFTASHADWYELEQLLRLVRLARQKSESTTGEFKPL